MLDENFELLTEEKDEEQIQEFVGLYYQNDQGYKIQLNSEWVIVAQTSELVKFSYQFKKVQETLEE